jgi:hypothetical protein
MKVRQKKDGFAMVVVISAIVVVFLLIFGLMGVLRNEVKLTSTMTDGLVAFYLAEAGLEQAQFVLKRDLGSQDNFINAMVNEEEFEITLPQEELDLLSGLVQAGTSEVRLNVRYEPDKDVEVANGAVGKLIVQSLGIYTTPQGVVAKRQVRAVFKLTAVNLGIVAPEHGLFVRDPRAQVFQVPNFSLDVRDLAVMGGNVYLAGGMRAELTSNLIHTEFRPMGELGIMDLGYDSFNLAGWLSGGMNFTHSRVIEYAKTERPITRKYFNFQGLSAVFGPGSAWSAVEEEYIPSNTRRTSELYSNDRINLREAEEYKELATTVVNPYKSYNKDGDPRDNNLFRSVLFSDAIGARSTGYNNVLPLYGYGDWRKVPAAFYGNPTRRDDLSQAIPVDGITYVRGDVFLEGWYDGLGTLVVEGNVYVGGDVTGLPPTLTGYHSLLNLVVLEDPGRESGSQSEFDRNTGKVIYKPHHDRDWDKLHLNLLREMDPVLDMAVYAQNGIDVDRTSLFDDFFNMQIEFNFVTENLDQQKLPNDLTIYGTDPQTILQREGMDPNEAFMFPVVGSEYLSWTMEAPSL